MDHNAAYVEVTDIHTVDAGSEQDAKER